MPPKVSKSKGVPDNWKLCVSFVLLFSFWWVDMFISIHNISKRQIYMFLKISSPSTMTSSFWLWTRESEPSLTKGSIVLLPSSPIFHWDSFPPDILFLVCNWISQANHECCVTARYINPVEHPEDTTLYRVNILRLISPSQPLSPSPKIITCWEKGVFNLNFSDIIQWICL